MARINLLPWRAERRKQRQKDFAKMLGLSLVAAIALAFLIISYHNGQIEGQNERNAFLQAEIAEVDKAIAEIDELDRQKSRLLARKEVIEQLQANRSQMVHLFDSLVRTIPDGAVLTSIRQDDQILTLNGRAQSNARVSTYMRNLEGSGWLTSPELAIIEAAGQDKGLPYRFTLQVKLANPNAPVDRDGDGIPDEPDAMPEGATPEPGTDPATQSAIGAGATAAPGDAAPAAVPAAAAPAPVLATGAAS
ncbi:PilN domain-containing protein [Lysobacter sp. D1-1-M9]|uniref:PilN domain-containing protein n=1 Tax=Novilysobacter longmucuonensis TaxID=3098603 RepID=UPI002FC72FE0